MTTEPKWTKGPWGVWIVGTKTVVTDDRLARHLAYIINGAPEHEANAHLIKAAPDMADALAPISDMAMWTESADDNEAVILTVGTVRRMRAALAKARGEA